MKFDVSFEGVVCVDAKDKDLAWDEATKIFNRQVVVRIFDVKKSKVQGKIE